jgi:hypothetical protein
MFAARAIVGTIAVGAVLAAGAATTPSSAGPPPAGAVLANGSTTIGVNNTGDLNFGGTGLAFNGNDALSPGCPCEGWGAGDETTGVEGHAGRTFGVSSNLIVESFTFDADSAVSVTRIQDGAAEDVLRVTHDYHPSAAANVFEVTVTLENASSDPVEPVYRRAMDWDVPPTAFAEYVTIQGSETADAITFASDDGFANGNPFSGPSHINFIGDAVDNFDTVLDPGGNGPSSDHGALFDFEFDTIAPGGEFTFDIYYGAAASEAAANATLGPIDAEVYSYGQPSSPDGATVGVPNTFIFAFAGVGGLVQVPSISFASPTYSVEEDQGTAVIGVQLSGPAAQEVTVSYTSSAGTATPVDDYTDVSDALVIPAGASSGSFEVPVVDDGIADGGETVTLVLSDPVNGELGDPITAVLTINDPTPDAPGQAPAPVPANPDFTG